VLYNHDLYVTAARLSCRLNWRLSRIFFQPAAGGLAKSTAAKPNIFFGWRLAANSAAYRPISDVWCGYLARILSSMSVSCYWMQLFKTECSVLQSPDEVIQCTVSGNCIHMTCSAPSCRGIQTPIWLGPIHLGVSLTIHHVNVNSITN